MYKLGEKQMKNKQKFMPRGKLSWEGEHKFILESLVIFGFLNWAAGLDAF